MLWILPVLAVCACNTPQIPLPPPDVASFPVTVDTASEQISFSGTVDLAGGQFIIIDQQTGNGIIRAIDATGHFDTGLFPAQDQQRFDMRYTDGHRSSDVLCVVVHYDAPDTHTPGLRRTCD